MEKEMPCQWFLDVGGKLGFIQCRDAILCALNFAFATNSRLIQKSAKPFTKIRSGFVWHKRDNELFTGDSLCGRTGIPTDPYEWTHIDIVASNLHPRGTLTISCSVLSMALASSSYAMTNGDATAMAQLKLGWMDMVWHVPFPAWKKPTPKKLLKTQVDQLYRKNQRWRVLVVSQSRWEENMSSQTKLACHGPHFQSM